MFSPNLCVLLVLLVSSTTSSSIEIRPSVAMPKRIHPRSSAVANAAVATDTVLHDEEAATQSPSSCSLQPGWKSMLATNGRAHRFTLLLSMATVTSCHFCSSMVQSQMQRTRMETLRCTLRSVAGIFNACSDFYRAARVRMLFLTRARVQSQGRRRRAMPLS